MVTLIMTPHNKMWTLPFYFLNLIKVPKTLLSSDKLHERTNKTNWNPEETARCLWNLNCINYDQLYLKLNITSLENLIVAQYNCSHWKGISRKCETPEIWCQSWSIFPQVPFLHMRDSDVSYLDFSVIGLTCTHIALVLLGSLALKWELDYFAAAQSLNGSNHHLVKHNFAVTLCR